MPGSDKVGLLATYIADYQSFQSIKASLDTNALMTQQDITYDGMLQVLYNNCPRRQLRYSNRFVNHLDGNNRRNGGKSSNKDDDNAWKKFFTKWRESSKERK